MNEGEKIKFQDQIHMHIHCLYHLQTGTLLTQILPLLTHNLQDTYRARQAALATSPAPITLVRRATQAPHPHLYSSHPCF